MPFFTSDDGVKLHYEVEGSGPVVIFHLGAGCDSDVWRGAGYVEPMARSHSCVLFDHRDDDLVGEAARLMPNAERIRVPEREHINAFLYSEFVVPRVLEFLAAK